MTRSIRTAVFLVFAKCSFLAEGQIYQEFEMPEEIHSVGINLTPAAVVLMNGSSFVSRFSAIYKRQTSVNQRVRVTLDYEIIENLNESISNASVVDFGEDFITYRLDNIYQYSTDVRFGLEWFKPERTFSMIYGVDAFVGIGVRSEGYEDRTYTLDESGFHPKGTQAESQEVRQFLTGVNLSIGQQIRTSEKVDVVVRWTPQFNLAIPYSETYSNPELRDEPEEPNLEFRPRGIELYLYVRF